MPRVPLAELAPRSQTSGMTSFPCRLRILVGFMVIVRLYSFVLFGQGIGIEPHQIIKSHADYGARFRAGDTNVPALVMHWFFGCNTPGGTSNVLCGFWSCRVDRTGNVSQGYFFISNTHGSLKPLSKPNVELLAEAIVKLPTPPKESLPYARQLVISGIRSNEWFQAVYDRANTPLNVKTLYDITGATLDCNIKTNSSPVQHK